MNTEQDEVTMTVTREEAREIQRRRDFIQRNTAAGTTWQMSKDLRFVENYYDTDIPRQEPVDIIPQEELPERHRLMLSLQTKIRQFKKEPGWAFDRQQISKMLCMQMKGLRDLESEATVTEWDERLDDFLDAILCPGRMAQHRTMYTRRQTGSTSTSTSQKTARGEKARNQVAERADHRCLFTFLSIFDVCHFVPFAAGSNSDTLDEISRLIPAMKPFFTPTEFYALERLIKENVGATDKPWNMVALNPTMHRQWSRLLFMLVWKGWKVNAADSRLADVTLQLRNLPRKQRNPKVCIAIEDTPQKLLDRVLHGFPKIPGTNQFETDWPDDYDVSATHHPSQRRILSGTTATVTIELKHVEKMKLMVDLLETCTRLRVLSGAAEPKDDYSPPPGPPSMANPLTVHNVEHWLYTLPNSEEQYESERRMSS